MGLLFVGTDYRITPDLIVGGLVQWDRSKDSFDALSTTVSGNGWMLGPYVSARVHEHIYLDLRAAWGSSWNDLNVGRHECELRHDALARQGHGVGQLAVGAMACDAVRRARLRRGKPGRST